MKKIGIIEILRRRRIENQKISTIQQETKRILTDLKKNELNFKFLLIILSLLSLPYIKFFFIN